MQMLSDPPERSESLVNILLYREFPNTRQEATYQEE